jgi:DNA-binding NarL/FixJ family response regulator
LQAPRGAAVHLDVDDSETPSSAAAIGLMLPEASIASLRALRVLIVDDHHALRKAVRGLLQECRELNVVGEAANGLEAITQAHALRPDVIVMDVTMPVMDGVEATRRIRAELPAIRIVGLSMYPRTEVRHAIEQAGAECLFTKGADMRRLIDHLIAMQAASLGFT